MTDKIKENKSAIVQSFQAQEGDTGSSAVQVALLTDRINHLNEHFKVFKKDYASRTGLMKLVGRRRRLLQYMKRKDVDQYKNVIEKLGLRR